jgi:putative DNA primase/helicase
VHWNVYLPDFGVDMELFEKLKSEADAILSLFVEGCLDWQQNGLVYPQEVLDATKAYVEREDRFGQWLKERCVFDNAYSEELTTLFSDYAAWCRERALDSLGRHNWRDELAERAPQLYQTNHNETRRAILNGIALRLDG